MAQAELYTASAEPAPLASVSTTRSATQPAQIRRSHRGRLELDHNPFCPTCRDEPEPEEAAGVPTIARCSLPLELVATMQAEPVEHSLATIAYNSGEHVGVFAVGDVVPPSARIIGIGAGVIHLENAGRIEYLPFAPPEKAKPSKPAKKKKKKRKPKKWEIPGASDAIKCTSGRHCTVERDFVAQVMANPVMLRKQARFLPKQSDGQVIGFKVYGIRRGSVPRLLKLKNGDMLTAINGRPLDSIDAVFRLLQDFRRASHLSVEVTRKGKTIEMLYDIV